MEIMKIISELERPTLEFTAYKMGGEYAAAVQEAIKLMVRQGERVAELEEEAKIQEQAVVMLRKKWQTAETMICSMCGHWDCVQEGNVLMGTMDCGQVTGYPDCKMFTPWIPTKVRKPEREFWENRLKYPDSDLEVLVMIHGAEVPTCLYFNAEGRFYEIDMYENMEFYNVDYWALMPEAPKEMQNGKS